MRFTTGNNSYQGNGLQAPFLNQSYISPSLPAIASLNAEKMFVEDDITDIYVPLAVICPTYDPSIFGLQAADLNLIYRQPSVTWLPRRGYPSSYMRSVNPNTCESAFSQNLLP